MAPKITCKLKIVGVKTFQGVTRIAFYTEPHVANNFETFGTLEPGADKNFYLLKVDPRYDADEVIEYMESWA